MTLQTSGAISLSQIQTEFGGASPIGLSEYYAGGGYVPSGTSGSNGAVPASGAIALSKFYGTSKYLDQQTLTIGTTSGCDKSGCWTYYGFSAGGYGSVSDGTFNPAGGAAITALVWGSDYIYPANMLQFSLNAAVANSGWSNLIIGGTTFTRASATFSSGTGFTTWQWTAASSPIATSGTQLVVFT